MVRKFFNRFSNLFFQNQLLAGSLVVLLGSTVTSLGSYLYHLVIGRMLGPLDYGVISSLISLEYIYGIPVGVMNVVVIKYISSLREGVSRKTATNFYYWVERKLLIIEIIGFLLLLAISPFLTSFLHLESIVLVILINISSLLSIYPSLFSATLQGFLRFGLNSMLSILYSVLKLIISIILIFLGMKVFGAVFSFTITSVIACLLSIFFKRRVVGKEDGGKEERKVALKEILAFAVPVFFSSLAFTSFYTIDIILSKHFLLEREAGLYGSLAVLGKIVYFASSTVGLVMFSLVSGRSAKGEDSDKVLFQAFIIVAVICFSITLAYFHFPKLMINTLFGKNYLDVSSELGLFAIFISFYSLASLLNNFYLATSKTAMVRFPLSAAFLQILLIFLFHYSIRQIVWVNIIVLGVLLTVMAIPFFGKIEAQWLKGCKVFGT